MGNELTTGEVLQGVAIVTLCMWVISLFVGVFFPDMKETAETSTDLQVKEIVDCYYQDNTPYCIVEIEEGFDF